MSGISVGAALGAGFGVIRRRPLSVLAWGAIIVGLQIVAYALFAPYYLAFYGAWLTSLAQGGGFPVDALNAPDMRRMQNLLQLFNLGQFFVVAVLYCAAFRSVLHPERSSFAYLRIGAAELFVVILSIAAFIALVIGMVVIILPVSLVAALVTMGGHAGALGVLVAIPIAFLAVMVAALFVGLRFSLVGPMMVEDGRFHLFDAWTLTRGRVGSLLLVGLGLFGIIRWSRCCRSRWCWESPPPW